MVVKRWGVALLVCGLLFPVWGHAAWQFLGFDNGNAAEYYDPAIQSKGQVKVITSFSEKPLQDMVPIHDPKHLDKYTLLMFRSEQSTYEFDCKAKTVQLTSRIFYRDVQGRFPLLTHTAKDPDVADASSEFAKQFRKTPVNARSGKNTRLMALACAAK